MNPTRAVIDVRKARGLMLGLVLGDSLGGLRGQVPVGTSPLRSTVAGQLTCTTVEGLIRALIRGRAKGVCNPVSVVWHALVRWAWRQGVLPDETAAAWRSGAPTWPDGLLSDVPVMGERRGSAPATIAALKQKDHGRRDAPTTNSAGYHGLVRTLPVALMGHTWLRLHELAQDVAALTHGAQTGHLPAADAVLFIAEALKTGDVHAAADDGLRAVAEARRPHPLIEDYKAAVVAGIQAADNGPDPHRLRKRRAALPALLDALYVISAFPDRQQVSKALSFAAEHGTTGTTATVGALLGACHGSDALPTEAVSRLELAWVADVLAQDIVRELIEAPSDATEHVEPGFVQFGDDPETWWWERYPGW